MLFMCYDELLNNFTNYHQHSLFFTQANAYKFQSINKCLIWYSETSFSIFKEKSSLFIPNFWRPILNRKFFVVLFISKNYVVFIRYFSWISQMNDLHTTHVQLAANLTATSKCQKAPERNTVVVSYQVVNINFSS